MRKPDQLSLQFWVIGHLHLTNLLWFYYLILVEPLLLVRQLAQLVQDIHLGQLGQLVEWLGNRILLRICGHFQRRCLKTYRDRRNCRNLAIAGISQRLHRWRRSIFHRRMHIRSYRPSPSQSMVIFSDSWKRTPYCHQRWPWVSPRMGRPLRPLPLGSLE